MPPGKHSCSNTISLYLVYVEMLVSRFSLIKNLSGLSLRFLRGICKTLEFPSDKSVCPGGSNGEKKKNLPAMLETWVQSLGQEDPLEQGMATHSSILVWRIPWRGEPGRL